MDLETLGSEIIVNSTVALARGLGIGVVAEGIEYGAQLRHLQSLGCERGQGFVFRTALTPAH